MNCSVKRVSLPPADPDRMARSRQFMLHSGRSPLFVQIFAKFGSFSCGKSWHSAASLHDEQLARIGGDGSCDPRVGACGNVNSAFSAELTALPMRCQP
jgi:hypothetical protein